MDFDDVTAVGMGVVMVFSLVVLYGINQTNPSIMPCALFAWVVLLALCGLTFVFIGMRLKKKKKDPPRGPTEVIECTNSSSS